MFLCNLWSAIFVISALQCLQYLLCNLYTISFAIFAIFGLPLGKSRQVGWRQAKITEFWPLEYWWHSQSYVSRPTTTTNNPGIQTTIEFIGIQRRASLCRHVTTTTTTPATKSILEHQQPMAIQSNSSQNLAGRREGRKKERKERTKQMKTWRLKERKTEIEKERKKERQKDR